MKKTIYKYVTQEQIIPLSVSLSGLILILVTGRLVQLARYLFATSLTAGDLIQVMALAMPKLILFALPMATLMGILLAFVRLNGDNELIAFRAAGISFRQFLPSVVSVSALVCIISFINMVYVVPVANKAFEDKLKSIGRAGLPALLKEGTFIDIIPNLVFFFRNVDTTDLSIRGIFVQDQRQADLRVSIVAETAQIFFQRDQNILTFKIANGIITRIPESLKDAQAISFREYDLTLSLDELFGGGSKRVKGRREMSLGELYRTIRSGSDNQERGYALEFHQRLALPLSCLLLGLVAAPLGAVFRQRNRMSGVTTGLVVYLCYYLVLSAGKGLAKNGLLSAALAGWMPNILTALLALYLWIKVQQETPFGIEGIWKRTDTLRQGMFRHIARIRKEHGA